MHYSFFRLRRQADKIQHEKRNTRLGDPLTSVRGEVSCRTHTM
jgi:hypothetical protein